MKPPHLKKLVDELKSLKEDDRLDKQTLDVVIWIATEYLQCEEGYNIGMKVQEDLAFIKKYNDDNKKAIRLIKFYDTGAEYKMVRVGKPKGDISRYFRYNGELYKLKTMTFIDRFIFNHVDWWIYLYKRWRSRNKESKTQ